MNIQALHEANVRFEHCMALDFEAAARRELRRACWVEWVAHYTYAQTRARIAHAEARVTELGHDASASDAAAAAKDSAAAATDSAAAPSSAAGLAPSRVGEE